MAKIRVSDIAQKMGIPEQDLLFKLQSIGVRVEGEDGTIDSELIKALLTGKQLPQTPQREVILRDPKSATSQPARKAPARRPAAPPPAGQMRPKPRRRGIVQKDQKIRTLPASEPVRRREEPAPVAPPKTERPAAKVKAPVKREQKKERSRADIVRELERGEDLSDFRGDVSRLEEVEARPVKAKVTPSTTSSAASSTVGASSTSRRSRRQSRRQEEAAAHSVGQLSSTLDVAQEGAITVAEGMTVRQLAEKLGVKNKDLIKLLIGQGVMATVNHIIDPERAVLIAQELGFEAMVVTFEEEVQLSEELQLSEEDAGTEPRPPVVTVMGHVDHGKTTLLDTIRSTKVTEGEHGGITQHIAAYRVERNGRAIVFLDTPGHEAFTQLRARGAKVTDVVILVVAADDGVMPQTKEAIDHAKAANVPIIVAMNKMDKADANPDRVKKELADNELLVEDWGGDIVCVPISALKGEGIDDLLEMVLLNTEMLELKANPELSAQGSIIEARKEPGRGIIATTLIQNGTARIGDIFVSGSTWGRIRLMVDDQGNRMTEAGPSTPVEISGFQDVPDSGDPFQVVEVESDARQIAEHRAEEQRMKSLAPSSGRLSLESLFARIAEDEVKELPVIVKADVQGSIEVLRETLQKTSTENVKVKIIRAGVGAITTQDVILASASNALIYGFNVRPERKASDLARKEEVDIRTHTVIYELVDELKKAMTGLLEPTYKEVELGRAEVREIFKVPKIGMIAGCHVVEGVIQRNASVRLLRDNVVVHEGKVQSLRRFKDDATEVRSGLDCGIGLESYSDLKPGDIIEAFKQEAVAGVL